MPRSSRSIRRPLRWPPFQRSITQSPQGSSELRPASLRPFRSGNASLLRWRRWWCGRCRDRGRSPPPANPGARAPTPSGASPSAAPGARPPGPAVVGAEVAGGAHGSTFSGSGAPLGLLGVAQLAGMGHEHQFQRLGQVLQQVEAVRHLHRPGSAAAGALGIGAGAVTGDDLHTGVGAQPGGERAGLAVGQQRHRAAALEVHQHGAVGVPLRRAQSSTPRADGVAQSGRGARRTRRSSVLRLAPSPSRAPSRAPPAPPRVRPRAVRRWASRAVRRAQGAATPGRRSAKMRRPHRVLSQNIRRTPSRTVMACSPQGRSARILS